MMAELDMVEVRGERAILLLCTESNEGGGVDRCVDIALPFCSIQQS